MKHRYRLNQICVFTNRGTLDYTGNDGKRCRIVRLKPPEEWWQGEPEYVIRFLDDNCGFGVRERELRPATINEEVV